MHDIIKLYLESGKVALINKPSLYLYRHSPNRVREAAVYALYHLRRGRLPHNRFVVFAQGRTGSTVLVDLMNSHPDIFMFGEIMQYNVIKNLRNPRKWAEGLATLSRQPVAGFKVKVYQLEKTQRQDPGKVLNDLHEGGWKIIYLRRTNLLRHAISDLRSEKTGHFHSTPGGAAPRGTRLKIDVSWDELVQHIEFREECLEKEHAALAGLPYLTIEYEQNLMGEDAQRDTMNRVYEFLGVPSHDASTGFKKVTSKNIGDDVANFDDLTARLEASGYAQYLGWG